MNDHQRPTARRGWGLWCDRGWPIVAGAAAALGLVAAWAAYGALGLAGFFALVLAGLGVCLWSLSEAFSPVPPWLTVVRSLGVALGVVSVTGLWRTFAWSGLAIAVAVAVTSPVAGSAVRRLRRQRRSVPGSGRPARPTVSADQMVFDQEFRDIVAHLTVVRQHKQDRQQPNSD